MWHWLWQQIEMARMGMVKLLMHGFTYRKNELYNSLIYNERWKSNKNFYQFICFTQCGKFLYEWAGMKWVFFSFFFETSLWGQFGCERGGLALNGKLLFNNKYNNKEKHIDGRLPYEKLQFINSSQPFNV